MSQPRKIFGTDGVRGVANIEPVTAETALKLGRAAAHVITKLSANRHSTETRPKIVLGKDTRLSGYMLENALVAGITSLGVGIAFDRTLAHAGGRLHYAFAAGGCWNRPLRLTQSLRG